MRTLLVCVLPFVVLACDKIPGRSDDAPKPAASPASAPPSATPSAVATASVAATASASQDKISDFPPVTYATYSNTNYGFAIQHPTFMTAQPLPAGPAEGQAWVWGNRAKIEVWAIDAGEETLEDFCKASAKQAGNKEKLVNNGACLVKGSLNGKAYWFKTHFIGKNRISIKIEYDETYKTNFEPIIHQVAVTIRLPKP